MATKEQQVSASVKREVQKAEGRDPKWPAARSRWLKKNAVCAACGERRKPQVHHVVPVHEDPSLELDPKNFITLCAFNLCHLRIGHGGSYRHWAPNVRELAAAVSSKTMSKTAAAKAARATRRLNDGVLET